VRVSHRRAHVDMTQEFLNAANINTGVEQVRRKRMAQRMRADFLRDLSFDNRARNRTTHRLLVLMVATQDPGGGFFGEPRRVSMIEINLLRFAPAKPRVAQPAS